jgi:hypothetical protein
LVGVSVSIHGRNLSPQREVMSVLLDIFTRPTRRLLLVAAMVGIFVGGNPATALGYQNVVLAWNPSPNADVVGYNVYYGTESGVYTAFFHVDNLTEAQISGLADGVTYYFAVSANDSAGNESQLSEEVSYTVPLPPPVTLGVQIFTETDGQPPYLLIQTTDSVLGWWEIHCSTDLQNWSLYTFGYGYGNVGRYGNGVRIRVPLDSTQPPMFFRLAKY